MNNILQSIIPAQAMGIQISGWSNGRATLSAPLTKNLNDKGTAFAGSIDSLLDLAGWSAITLALHDASIEADVMIVKSETEYTAAIRADMTASAEISRDDAERIGRELKERGRSRVTLTSRLESENKNCAAMTAQYAIIAKTRCD